MDNASFFADTQHDLSPVHVGFVVGKVVLVQKFLRVLPFSLSVLLASVVRTLLFIHQRRHTIAAADGGVK